MLWASSTRCLRELRCAVVTARPTAKPFIKWAGGKGRLLEQIAPLVPAEVHTWVEPFLGGGASLFGLGVHRAKSVIAGDVNTALINAFRCVRDDVEGVMLALDDLQRLGPYRDQYYRERSAFNSWLISVEGARSGWPCLNAAAQFIYLNKTGYNGLWRVNKLGELNVACGDYKEPRIYDSAELIAASKALRHVSLCLNSASSLLGTAAAGNKFYFLDPPYTPTSATAGFTGYSVGGFTHAHHLELRDACRRIDKDGGKFLLCQADTPLTRELYYEWDVRTVSVQRSISMKASTRGATTELVVRNYTTSEDPQATDPKEPTT